jgi:para-aminobenzoate synthetase component 1
MHATRARLAAASFVAQTSSAAYQAWVDATVEAIAAGEIFQANIARHWSGHLPAGAAPFDVMARLVHRSPAPFAGYLRLPGLALVSNSPERFMEVTAAGGVRTQPIKGTRPRGRTPAEDAANAAELLASEKDHAENLMIVDLMRNDLARACMAGSVRVPALCALESFANVHHLVSTVTGQLAKGMTALDAFAHAFPPGSITGAPKLQSMAVIARHEAPRGPYCGSLFWAGCDGAFDSSVLIRTIAFAEDAAGAWRFDVRAGAAITADSIPADEDAETQAKIAAIRDCLAGC